MTTDTDHNTLTRTYDDGRYAWTRTRRVRRRIVAAEALLLAGLTAFTLATAVSDAGGWNIPFIVVWAVALFGFIPLHSLLNLGIRGLYDRAAGSLDEHQQHLREKSHTAMSWPSAGLTLAAWAGGITLLSVTGQLQLALSLAFVLWFVAGLLAYWHLAWTIPDEEAAFDGEG